MARKPRPKLSSERVLDVALALIDRDGLAGFSMRKLGAELGIEAMTLYYYFPNKDTILDGLIERVTCSYLTYPHSPVLEWTAWLRELAISLRQELLRHPRLIPLIATRPVLTPAALEVVEQLAARLGQDGFSPLHAFQIINIITTFVNGHLLAEVGDTPGHEEVIPHPEQVVAELDPVHFPYFTQALQQQLGQPADHESRFLLALDALTIGLATLFAREEDR